MFSVIDLLVVSHDSMRGCVRLSVGPSVRPSVRNLFFFGGQKRRRRTTYAVYPALYEKAPIVFLTVYDKKSCELIIFLRVGPLVRQASLDVARRLSKHELKRDKASILLNATFSDDLQ